MNNEKKEAQKLYFDSQKELQEERKKILKNKYYFIIAIFIIVLFLMLKIVDTIKHQSLETIVYEKEFYKENIGQILNDNKDKIIFNNNNEMIIKVEDICNGIFKNNVLSCEIMNDKETHQCLGYLIIKNKHNGKYDIDAKHFCDMID